MRFLTVPGDKKEEMKGLKFVSLNEVKRVFESEIRANPKAYFCNSFESCVIVLIGVSSNMMTMQRCHKLYLCHHLSFLLNRNTLIYFSKILTQTFGTNWCWL